MAIYTVDSARLVQQKNGLRDMGLQWWFRVMGGEGATIYGP